MSTTTTVMLDAALDHAGRGWRIFPVRRPGPDGICGCNNPNCTIPGKHPHITEWPTKATTDEATIRHWWRQWPNANIGHELTGRIGLDVDPRHGGDTSLVALLAEIGPLPATPAVLTGGGGEMFLFDAAGAAVKNNAGDLAAGLDIRAAGGMVLLPPSLHRSGRRYEWEASSHPDDVPIAPIPPQLLDRIKASQLRGGPRSTTPNPDAGDHISDGRRNTTLTSLAGSMRHRGMSEESILAALRVENETRCDPPLADADVRKIAASVARYAPAPRGSTFTIGGNGHATHTNGQGGDTAATAEGTTNRERPILDAGDQHLPRITAAAWDALSAANDPPFLFRFGGQLVRLEGGDEGTPLAVTLTDTRLRYELAEAADWEKEGKTGLIAAKPPIDVVRNLLAAPDPPLPILEAIAEVPTFTPDGELHDTPGYHPGGRTFYAPPDEFSVTPVPARPGAGDIARARALIADELLGDFPFIGDPERAHAIGLLILPFARALIDGPTPLHLIEKPQVGTGATLLADMLTLPAIGKASPAMTEARDDDEWRKRITAQLRTRPAVVLIDNLRDRLDTAQLAAALTATEWTDRLLGTPDMIRLPVRCAWIATGNNPALSSEMARRTVRIRLDAMSDRPWLRRDFRHPNLREWAIEHRPEIVRAALTIVTAWLADGKPSRPEIPRFGMFENWARVISGILDTAGIAGFLGNMDELYEHADTEGAAIRALLDAWYDAHATTPVTSAELWPLVENARVELDLGEGSLQARKIRFGNFIAKLRDRQYEIEAGLVQVASAGSKKNAQRWRLQPGRRRQG